MIKWLKKLFGIHTADFIVRPLSKITDDLHALIEDHAITRKAKEEIIKVEQEAIAFLHKESEKATRIAASITSILEG